MAYIPSLNDLPNEYSSSKKYIPNLDDIDSTEIVPRESFESAFGDLRTPQEKISDFAQRYVNDPVEAARAGIVRGLTGINQAIMKPADLLYGTNFVGEAQKGQQIRDAQFEAQFGKNNFGANATRFLGELALPGGIGTKAIKWGEPFLKFIGKNILAGAPIGLTTYDPSGEGSFLEKTLGGMAAGGLTSGGLKTVAALNPLKLFGKNINKAELKKVNEALGDLETPLGNVLNSPTLKHLQENVLANIPGSGVYASAQRTNQSIEEEGKGILDSLKGNFDLSDIDAREILRGALIGRGEKVRNIKNKLYGQGNQLAEKIGLKISPTNYQNEAKQLLSDMTTKNFPELADKAVEKFLYKAASPKKEESFKNLNLVRGKLNKKIQQAKITGNFEEVGVYDRLKKALDADRESAIARSSNDRLKGLFNRAQRFYGKVYAPFKEKEITRFTKPGADSDLLTNFFVRSGKSDRGNLTTKLMNKLSPDEKNLVAYDYFSKALVEDLGTGSISFNPTKFTNLYRNLGKSTRKALFPDEQLRKQMDQYLLKTTRNKEGLNMLFNPKTGARILSTLIPAGLGAMGGYAEAGKGGGVLGAIAMLGGGALGARAANKLLTSPKMRKKIIEKLTSEKMPSPGKGAGLGALISAESIGAQ